MIEVFFCTEEEAEAVDAMKDEVTLDTDDFAAEDARVAVGEDLGGAIGAAGETLLLIEDVVP